MEKSLKNTIPDLYIFREIRYIWNRNNDHLYRLGPSTQARLDTALKNIVYKLIFQNQLAMVV